MKQHEACIGVFAYHYRHLEFERCLRKGSSQLVRVVQLVKSSGEIAYHYPYLQYSRVVRKGVLLSGTTRSSRATGETVSHYRYLEFEEI